MVHSTRGSMLSATARPRAPRRPSRSVRSQRWGRRQATAKKNEIIATVNRADYIIQSQVKLYDFLTIYMKSHVAKLGSNAQAKYKSLIKNHIRPEFERSMLCEITTLRVQDWLDAKAQEDYSWNTRADIRNILSSIFTKAIDWGRWKSSNPIEAVSLGRQKAGPREAQVD